MFFYKHKLRDKDIKNIPFFTALFSLVVLILYFSGCVSFCSLDSSEDKECISYTEALAVCERISKPIQNYPICSDFSKSKSLDSIYQNNCDNLFSERISKELNFVNLSLNSEQLSNKLRRELINSWKSSDKIAFGYKLINEDCDSFFTSNFSEYKYDIKKELYYFDNYNKSIVLLIIADLISIKKDLQDNNVEQIQNTLLYSDYIELNNILNEFQKSFGKDIDVKESSITNTINFYTKYYSNSESNTNLSDAISTLSANTKENEQISTFIGWAVALTGVIGFGLVNPANSTIALLVKGFNLSESFSNKVSNIIENASEKTNLSEWNKLEVLRKLLIDFEITHGEYNYNDKVLFELFSNIDLHISQIKKSNIEKQNQLLMTLNKLMGEIDEMIIEKEMINILYARYNIIESPLNLKEKALSLRQNIENLNNLNYGEMHYYLLQYNSEFESLKLQTETYFSSDYKSILSLCSSDIISLKSKIINLPESQEKIILQSYIDLFLTSKDESKKLNYCAKIISLTSNDMETSCLAALQNLSNNMSLNVNLKEYSEAQCNLEINKYIIDAYDFQKYISLEQLYSKLKAQQNLLNKIYSQSMCITNSEYQLKIKELQNYFSISAYSDNQAMAGLLNKNLVDLELNIAKTIDSLDVLLSKSLSCFYNYNYELDLKDNFISFSHNLDNYDIDFKLRLTNYGLIDIKSDGCLKSTEISKEDILFNFKCVDNSKYAVVFKDLTPKTNILNLTANLFTGTLETRVCIPSQSELKYLLNLPVDETKIISVYLSNSDAVVAKINNNKLELLFGTISKQERCVDVSYLLNSPIVSDLNLEKVEVNEYTKFYFNLEIKNTLYYNIDKLKYYLTIPENKEIKEINLKENGVFAQPVSYDSKSPYFNLSLFALESKKYNYLVIAKNDLNLDIRIKELRDKINQLKYIEYIDGKKILEFLSELNNIEKLTSISEKEKRLFVLEKELNNIYSDYEINKLYISQYLSLKGNIEKLKNDYLKVILILKNDYNIIVSESLFLDLDNKLLEAEQLYKNGKIKDAIKVLNGANISKLKNVISDIFLEYVKKTKELLTTGKQLGVKDYSLDFSKLAYSINSFISNEDYLSALEKISEYSNLQKAVEKEIKDYQNFAKVDVDNAITKYSEYKKKLDDMWQRFSDLENSLNSNHYDAVKNFGIDFGFTKSNLTSLKNKLTTATNKLVNLDKESKIVFSEFKFEKFDDFYSDIDNLNDLLNQYYQTMKNKAQNEITFAASKASINNMEFYKAKDAYDSNNFVDAIYYAKLSQLNSKETNKTNWSLYAGLGFIALLVVLVILFGRKFDFSERKIKKETYYSIDKEE